MFYRLTNVGLCRSNMGNIKYTFTIKDLEYISEIKAHTIRIWEKRYELLEPIRTETNIRLYDLQNLQKLLNVAVLNENGHKISKIAKLNIEENRETATKMAIRSIPTLMIFKDGQRVDMVVGAVPKTTLANTLEKYL